MKKIVPEINITENLSWISKISPLVNKSKNSCKISCQLLVSFYRKTIFCREHTNFALFVHGPESHNSESLKPSRTLLVLLPNIGDTGRLKHPCRALRTLKNKTNPDERACSPCIVWQVTLKYPLPYHQTTGQPLSSCNKALEN